MIIHILCIRYVYTRDVRIFSLWSWNLPIPSPAAFQEYVSFFSMDFSENQVLSFEQKSEANNSHFCERERESERAGGGLSNTRKPIHLLKGIETEAVHIAEFVTKAIHCNQQEIKPTTALGLHKPTRVTLVILNLRSRCRVGCPPIIFQFTMKIN